MDTKTDSKIVPIEQPINKELMEQQILEMWQATSDIPDDDPGKKAAIDLATEIEIKMRKKYMDQERIRNQAPALLQALIKVLEIAIRYGIHADHPEFIKARRIIQNTKDY